MKEDAIAYRVPPEPHVYPSGVDRKSGIALSGGGSHGAFAAGIVYGFFSRLWSTEQRLPRLALVTGTSTGSLVGGLLTQAYGLYFEGKDPADELERMRTVYTRTTQNQVGVEPKCGILGVGWNLLRKHGVLDVAPLRKLIDQCYDHERMQSAAEHGLVYVCNFIDMVQGQARHYSTKTQASAKPRSREEMIDAIFASCAQPVVMTPAYVRKRWAVDGGVREVIPFREGMRADCTSLLAVALNEPTVDRDAEMVKRFESDVLARIKRGLAVMNDEVARDDERLANMSAYINRARDELLRSGVAAEVVDRALPAEVLPSDIDPAEPGDQDPNEDGLYERSELREMLVCRFSSTKLPEQEKFIPAEMQRLFDWGTKLADQHFETIKGLLAPNGYFTRS
ncbi:MAG: patatin-like phospholipase family protein [Polyangiaceae bacterium]